MSGLCRWLAGFVGCLCLPAVAELQAVSMNGFFVQQEDSKRTVEVSDLSSGLIQLDAPTPDMYTGPHLAWHVQVGVPKKPMDGRYNWMGRVGLSLAITASDDASEQSLDAVVFVNESIAAQFPVPNAWQTRIVDLTPWEGETVDISLRAASLRPDTAPPLLVARVRMLTWYGPYYGGIGGLNTGPGPHGMPMLTNHPEDYRGRLTGFPNIRISFDDMSAPPLMLARIDCIEDTTILLSSGKNFSRNQLYRGMNWLTIPLDSERNFGMGGVKGRAEQGPVDIIPDFTLNDAPELDRMLAEWRAAQASDATPGE